MQEKDASFLGKVGGHNDDIKNNKLACSHINDGLSDIEGPFSPKSLQNGCAVDGIGKKTLTEEELEELVSQQQ